MATLDDWQLDANLEIRFLNYGSRQIGLRYMEPACLVGPFNQFTGVEGSNGYDWLASGKQRYFTSVTSAASTAVAGAWLRAERIA